MLIRYIGKRDSIKVTLNRKDFFFSRENNKTIETCDQKLINYIFSLPNNFEFSVVPIADIQEVSESPEPVVEKIKQEDNIVLFKKKKNKKKK